MSNLSIVQLDAIIKSNEVLQSLANDHCISIDKRKSIEDRVRQNREVIHASFQEREVQHD